MSMMNPKDKRLTIALKLHPDAVKRLKEIARQQKDGGYLTHARGILEDALLPVNHPARNPR